MISPSLQNISPREIRRRRKGPKDTVIVKKIEIEGEDRTKIKSLTIATDRFREDRNEILGFTKPFPAPDRKEKIAKKIEIPDDALDNSFGFDKEEDRELITNILTVRTRRRGEKEIALLQKAFKTIKFFEQVETEVDSISFNKIFQKLTIETYKPGQTIFDLSDIGRKFYIVIKGSVFILLKNDVSHIKRGSIRSKGELEKMRQSLGAYLEESESDEHKKNHVERCYPGFWVVRTMGEGLSFGEIALNKNSDGRRTATVICKEEVSLGVLSYNDYQNILGGLYERKYRQKIEFLSNIDFLGHWTDNQLSSLILNMEEVRYARKNVIFKEGEPANHMYFIIKGEVELQKNVDKDSNTERSSPLHKSASMRYLSNNSPILKTKSIKTQEPIKIGILTEKGYFGESELINPKPREYTAVALSSEVTLLSIAKDKFDGLIQDQESVKLVQVHSTKKNILREERAAKFLQRNVSIDLNELSSAEDISPITKIHRYTSSETFSKYSTSVPTSPRHLLNLEPQTSLVQSIDQSGIGGGSHHLDKSLGSPKMKSVTLNLQRSPSKVNSVSISEADVSPLKFIFKRELTFLKNPKKAHAQLYMERQKWLQETVKKKQMETEEEMRANESPIQKQINNEIEENHESFNFVKKGVPLTQVGKVGSFSGLTPTIKEEKKRLINSNISLDCLDKKDAVVMMPILKNKEPHSPQSHITSIENIKSLNFENASKSVRSITIKAQKPQIKTGGLVPFKVHADLKGIIKKQHEKAWPPQEGQFNDKDYFSYRGTSPSYNSFSPRLQSSLATFRQPSDYPKKGQTAIIN